MVTRKEVEDAFREDGAYNLVSDFFQHIVNVKSKFCANDVGSEEICQFIKYASYDQKNTGNWFFPIFGNFETVISGTYKNTDLKILRLGKGTGSSSLDTHYYFEFNVNKERVCAFTTSESGYENIISYKRGDWISMLRKENSLLNINKQKEWLKLIGRDDQPLSDENFKL